MFVDTETQADLREAARQAAESILGPSVKADDESETYRKDLFAALGEAGLCGVSTSEEFGGLGLGYSEYIVVLEEIAKVSSSYAVSVAVSGLPQVILAAYGNQAQKEK